MLPCLFVVLGTSPDSVAVAWYSAEAKAERAAQQRVASALGKALTPPPRRVWTDPMVRVRRIAAYEVERSQIELLVRIQAQVQRAEVLFRGGDLDAAEQEITEAMAQLVLHPVLPGAARLATSIHFLEARVAWSRGAWDEARIHILGALTLDPKATLSTRRVPPDFAAEVQSIQDELRAGEGAWPRWTTPEAPGVLVEIDGVFGSRPVPPGQHFVVVRRLGEEPRGQLLHSDDPWVELPSRPSFESEVVGQREIDAMCERLRVDHVLLVAQRLERWGVQAFRCAAGFGAPVYAESEGLERVLPRAFDGPFDGTAIALSDPWPPPPPSSESTATPPKPAVPNGPVAKPWYRRAWIWSILGAAVIGGATTAAVLSTRERPPGRIEVPGPDFIGP